MLEKVVKFTLINKSMVLLVNFWPKVAISIINFSKIRPNIQSESIDMWVLTSKFNIQIYSDIRTLNPIE